MTKSWGIKNLYFYMVCLVTLFLFVGGAIATINSAMELALPDKPNVPLIYVYYPEPKGESAQTVFDPPGLEELEKRRAEQEEIEVRYQGYTKRRLLNSLALMIIAAPFYFYHWRQVKPVSRKRGFTDEN